MVSMYYSYSWRPAVSLQEIQHHPRLNRENNTPCGSLLMASYFFMNDSVICSKLHRVSLVSEYENYQELQKFFPCTRYSLLCYLRTEYSTPSFFLPTLAKLFRLKQSNLSFSELIKVDLNSNLCHPKSNTYNHPPHCTFSL